MLSSISNTLSYNLKSITCELEARKTTEKTEAGKLVCHAAM